MQAPYITTNFQSHLKPMITEKCQKQIEESIQKNQKNFRKKYDCPDMKKVVYGLEEPESAKLIWLTFSTICTFGMYRLVESVYAHDQMKVYMTGMNEEWRGWGQRVRTYYDFLFNVPDDQLVIVSDADDVLFLPSCSVEQLISTYKRFETPVVYMAEKWKDPEVTEERLPMTALRGSNHSKSSQEYSELNAGVVMGPAKYLRKLFEYVYLGECEDDQKNIYRAYLNHLKYWERTTDYGRGLYKTQIYLSDQRSQLEIPSDARPLISLDHYQEMYLSLFDAKIEQFEFEDGRLLFKPTGTKPCVLHQHGWKGQNHIMEEVCKEIGLPYNFLYYL